MSRFMLFAVLVSCLTGCRGDSEGGRSSRYPTRQVTILCPWAAGGGTDRVSRFWADALKQKFDTPFTVVNRTGGSGAVGHSAGAQARPDGYTLTTITFELSTMHQMGISTLTYEDYECLLQINADPAAIMVRSDAPWTSLNEFLEDAQKRKLKMSGTARGGAWDLARAGLFHAAGLPVDTTIWVPTEGSAPSIVELLGGHIDAVCCSVPEAAAQLQAGELRVLAVMSDQRLVDYPDIATARESGVDWVAVGWRGLAVPKDTPPEIVNTLEQKCLEIAESDAYADFMKKNQFGIVIKNSAEFREFLVEQDAQWKKVIEAAGYSKS